MFEVHYNIRDVLPMHSWSVKNVLERYILYIVIGVCTVYFSRWWRLYKLSFPWYFFHLDYSCYHFYRGYFFHQLQKYLVILVDSKYISKPKNYDFNQFDFRLFSEKNTQQIMDRYNTAFIKCFYFNVSNVYVNACIHLIALHLLLVKGNRSRIPLFSLNLVFRIVCFQSTIHVYY